MFLFFSFSYWVAVTFICISSRFCFVFRVKRCNYSEWYHFRAHGNGTLCNLWVVSGAGPSIYHPGLCTVTSVGVFMSPYTQYSVGCQVFSLCHAMCNKESISRQFSIAYSWWKVAGGHHTANWKPFVWPHILPCYCHFIDLGLAFTRALLQDPTNRAPFPSSTIALPGLVISNYHFLSSWHEKHTQSRKWCSLFFCFYCLLHIQRGPWCPFPYLSSTFYSVTCSYGINKKMNHNSLDKERALEPSNPQSAHIYRHHRCCCWFYLKLGNAGLRLQQGRTMWRQMHALQLKLVLSVSVGMASLVQKYTLSNQVHHP